MWKYFVLYSALACGVMCYNDKFIIEGHWNVDRTESCPDSDQYEYQIELRKNKVNRTHVAFNGFMDIKEDLTEDGFGAYLEAEKKVDGGYKMIQVFDEDSLFRFMNKYVAENFKSLLTNIGAEPQSPLPKGYYKIVDYSFDYSELPREGLIGLFKVTFYLTRQKQTMEKEKIACCIVYVSLLEDEDYDDE